MWKIGIKFKKKVVVLVGTTHNVKLIDSIIGLGAEEYNSKMVEGSIYNPQQFTQNVNKMINNFKNEPEKNLSKAKNEL